MARANLHISKQLSDAFLAAQESTSTVRAIKSTIANEEIGLTSVIQLISSSQDDFNQILPPNCTSTEAAFFIYRLSETATENTRKWLLIAWIPDGCRVRDKMLYSSSREDLKRSLGLGQFCASDYSASVATDLTWEAYQGSTVVAEKGVNLTAKEVALKQEELLTQAERSALGSKSIGMGVVPFTLGDGVQSAFRNLITGKHNWVELSVVSEVINLAAAKSLEINDNLEAHVDQTAPRFIIARFSNFENKPTTFFIYSCPENIKIRDKMTMSTSKATVIGAAGDSGITLDKAIEIHGPGEIVDSLNSELAAPVERTTDSVLSHAKPQRPGKGKAVVKKFQLDA